MKPKRRKPRGRPSHEPTERTRRLCELMVAASAPKAVISRAIGISIRALDKHYPNELTGVKPGQPAYMPSLQDCAYVERCTGYGASHEEIAGDLGIDRHTLAKYFPKELQTGGHRLRMNIMESLTRQALGAKAEYDERGKLIREEIAPHPSVAMFMGKVRCGLRERDPIPPPAGEREGTIDMSRWTDEEVMLYDRLLAKATDPAYRDDIRAGASGASANSVGNGKAPH
jgi:hypothetical protein